MISKIAGWGIWIVFVLLVFTVAKDISRSKAIDSQIEAQKAKIAKIEAENNKLIQQITEAQNPEFVEKEVRNKLGLGKAGEAMVVMPENDVLRKLAPRLTEEEEMAPDPNWKKWLQLFI